MNVGYVEKTFETFINSELLSKYGQGLSPGQHEEGFVGFDFYFSLNSPTRTFTTRYPGVDIDDILKYVERRYRTVLNRLPSIKVNMLLQYKCPEYLKSPIAKERFWWGRDYYRYRIDVNQQKLIQDIHDNFADVLVLYAAPAIESVNQLYNYSLTHQIIENTNFTEGCRLTGHSVNTYVEARGTSKAFSEMEEIPSFDISTMKQKYENRVEIDNVEFSLRFSNQLKEMIINSPDLAEGYKVLANIYLNNSEVNMEEYPLADALITTSIFTNLTGITRFCYV